MNNDLISRSELLKHTQGGDWDGVGFSREYVEVDDIIKAPTVELFCAYLSDGEVRQPCVESPCKHERPQGEKIKKEHYGWVYCSECDSLLGQQDNFCWNCGADMRGNNK